MVLLQAQVEEKRRVAEHRREIELADKREEESDNSLVREEQTLERQIRIEELKIRQVELNTSAGSSPRAERRSTAAPKLPPFDESRDNIDVYLMRFERHAKARGWPEHEWAVDLSALLSGKGLEVYYSLNENQANEYETLKKAILIRYEHHEEGFRKKFKNSKPESGESGAQYANRLLNYFQRWTSLASVDDSKAGLLDLMVRDEFLHSVPRDVAMFLREREPCDIDTMVELTDRYLKAHGSQWSHDRH